MQYLLSPALPFTLGSQSLGSGSRIIMSDATTSRTHSHLAGWQPFCCWKRDMWVRLECVCKGKLGGYYPRLLMIKMIMLTKANNSSQWLDTTRSCSSLSCVSNPSVLADTGEQNMQLWHEDYFELKLTNKDQRKSSPFLLCLPKTRAPICPRLSVYQEVHELITRDSFEPLPPTIPQTQQEFTW